MHIFSARPPRLQPCLSRAAQRGLTLIELLVGITIGLMAIATAMGALLLSRTVTGTVSDASQLQQQAAYAFRIMGQQFRQAASMELRLASNKPAVSDSIDPADPVAFSPNPDLSPVAGKDSPTSGEYALAVAYQNYQEKLFPSGDAASQFRDCLGREPSSSGIQNQFVLRNNELLCAGADNEPQALIKNVAQFQVSYLVQTNAANGLPTLQRVNAATANADWSQVFGIHVCLSLYGDEIMDLPANSTYNGCNGAVDISSSGSLPATQKNRLHLSFSNVYQLRSQGLAG